MFTAGTIIQVVHTGTGVAIIVGASVLLILTAFVIRPRVPKAFTDVLSALCGVAVGVGGLLLLHHDVSLGSWLAAPLILALASVAHTRALFGGSGPFRT